MSTATLKRELALLRSSLAALKPSESATFDDPVAWAERIAGLTLDPWQRDVLLSWRGAEDRPKDGRAEDRPNPSRSVQTRLAEGAQYRAAL